MQGFSYQGGDHRKTKKGKDEEEMREDAPNPPETRGPKEWGSLVGWGQGGGDILLKMGRKKRGMGWGAVKEADWEEDAV